MKPLAQQFCTIRIRIRFAAVSSLFSSWLRKSHKESHFVLPFFLFRLTPSSYSIEFIPLHFNFSTTTKIFLSFCPISICSFRLSGLIMFGSEEIRTLFGGFFFFIFGKKISRLFPATFKWCKIDNDFWFFLIDVTAGYIIHSEQSIMVSRLQFKSVLFFFFFVKLILFFSDIKSRCYCENYLDWYVDLCDNLLLSWSTWWKIARQTTKIENIHIWTQ